MQLCSKNHLSTFGAIPIARINRTLGVATAAPAGSNPVSSPTSAERSASTNATPVESSDPAAELAFWDAVKNSTSGDDFRAYLKKFPNGTFADLANNRLKILEKAEEAKRATEEIARHTKSIKGSYGIFGKTGSLIVPGELFVSPGKIELKPANKSAFVPGVPERSEKIYIILEAFA